MVLDPVGRATGSFGRMVSHAGIESASMFGFLAEMAHHWLSGRGHARIAPVQVVAFVKTEAPKPAQGFVCTSCTLGTVRTSCTSTLGTPGTEAP